MRVNSGFFDRKRETVSSAQTVPADRVDILSCRRYLYYNFSVLSFSRKKTCFFSDCSTRDSTAEYRIVHIQEQARYMDVPFIVTAIIDYNFLLLQQFIEAKFLSTFLSANKYSE